MRTILADFIFLQFYKPLIFFDLRLYYLTNLLGIGVAAMGTNKPRQPYFLSRPIFKKPIGN